MGTSGYAFHGRTSSLQAAPGHKLEPQIQNFGQNHSNQFIDEDIRPIEENKKDIKNTYSPEMKKDKTETLSMPGVGKIPIKN